jgi:ABC-2 type transport system permease protein
MSGEPSDDGESSDPASGRTPMPDGGATGGGSAVAVFDEAMREQFSWYVVAKKEFQDTARSKALWVLSLVFVVLFVVPLLGVYFDVLGLGQITQELGTTVLIRSVYLNLVTFLLPLIAMFVGYAALTRERESGSLKVLLSLPFSRRDVLVGKVVGRCAVVALPLLVGLGLTALFLVSLGVPFEAGLYGLFSLFTVGFALVMVAIAVSISAAVPSGRLSLVANFFVYFYFTFVWNSVANGLGNLLQNQLGVAGALRWQLTLFVKLLSPTQSYKTLLNSVLGSGANAQRSARIQMFSRNSDTATICNDVLRGNATVQQTLFGNQTVCQSAGDTVPFYFSDPAVFVYLLVWIGVAAALSYYTFDRVDL